MFTQHIDIPGRDREHEYCTVAGKSCDECVGVCVADQHGKAEHSDAHPVSSCSPRVFKSQKVDGY